MRRYILKSFIIVLKLGKEYWRKEFDSKVEAMKFTIKYKSIPRRESHRVS